MFDVVCVCNNQAIRQYHCRLFFFCLSARALIFSL
uniref:Uncharacterized protein n=1 Tax=Anguilla anguilla TaxID=7936 RepID=A0A0E9UMT7_ANGAN